MKSIFAVPFIVVSSICLAIHDSPAKQGAQCQVWDPQTKTELPQSTLIAGYLYLERNIQREETQNQELVDAVLAKDFDAVSLLLSRGANVHAATPDGIPAIFLAAMFDNVEMVKLFLDFGFDTEFRVPENFVTRLSDISNKTLLEAFVASSERGFPLSRKQRIRYVKILLEYGGRGAFTELMLATFLSDKSAIRCALISEKERIDEVHPHLQLTALHLAAKNQDVEAVDLLLTAGASPAVKSGFGDTILLIAARSDNLSIAQLAIEYDTPIDARTSSGWTPLIWAAANGSRNVFDLLLRSGADIDIKGDPDPYTALMEAAEKCRPYFVAELLAREADVTITGGYVLEGSATALSMTCFYDYDGGKALTIAKALIAAGANPHHVNGDGSTLLSRVSAEESTPDELLQLLQ